MAIMGGPNIPHHQARPTGQEADLPSGRPAAGRLVCGQVEGQLTGLLEDFFTKRRGGLHSVNFIQLG